MKSHKELSHTEGNISLDHLSVSYLPVNLIIRQEFTGNSSEKPQEYFATLASDIHLGDTIKLSVSDFSADKRESGMRNKTLQEGPVKKIWKTGDKYYVTTNTAIFILSAVKVTQETSHNEPPLITTLGFPQIYKKIFKRP